MRVVGIVVAVVTVSGARARAQPPQQEPKQKQQQQPEQQQQPQQHPEQQQQQQQQQQQPQPQPQAQPEPQPQPQPQPEPQPPQAVPDGSQAAPTKLARVTEKSDRYPLAITDRPVVLPPGVTELGFSQSLQTRVETMTDAMGNTSKSRTGFFDDRQTGLSIAHAFGSFEIGLGVDSYHLHAWTSIDTHSIPAGFTLSASMLVPQRDGRYVYRQRAAVEHKLVLAPKRFALHGSTSIELYEVNGDNAMATRVKGSIITADARFLTETQLLRRLGLYAGVSAGAPVYETQDYGQRAGLSVNASLLFALRKWDFYAYSSVSVRRDPWTYLALGLNKRWGL